MECPKCKKEVLYLIKGACSLCQVQEEETGQYKGPNAKRNTRYKQNYYSKLYQDKERHEHHKAMQRARYYRKKERLEKEKDNG